MAGLDWDAIVIGGGFFGCEVALELRRLGFERILVAEREEGVLRRASFVNQARVHNGYHYPRSYATGARSRMNFSRFADEYREAIFDSFVKLYAIARGSRVSASQFVSFCSAIGAPCRPASEPHRRLFDLQMIEECFLTEEYAFDSSLLAKRLIRQLEQAGIELRTRTAARLHGAGSSSVEIDLNGKVETASWLFNCTYSDLERSGITLKSRLKKELTEMILIEPPIPVAGLGVTVMDGPYFSTMPFPAAGLHSLSHVRYTPHMATEMAGDSPPPPERSNRDYMLRDAARYMPCLSGAKVVRSIFELKAVLTSAENDDARPIMIERAEASDRILSILGAKIDNIYDIREYLGRQSWN